MQRKFLFLIIVVSVLVNFVAVLGPELGFDALWYHLTIPKLYLIWNQIKYIPGGLLYYSAMPKLGELIFMLGNANFLFAHIVSFIFGIGSAGVTYLIARKFLDSKYSLLAVIIFYVTPLVGWLSGSAYVDLIRTFFESLAFLLILNNSLIFAGISIAMAVGTKTLALGSVPVLLIIIFLKTKKLSKVPAFLSVALLLSAPWFIWSYLSTGHPFFPINAGILDSRHSLRVPNPLDLIRLFTTSPDPINPIYLIILPFIFKRFNLSILSVYALFALLLWLVTPRTDWGRFILPYLPVLAVYVAYTISRQEKFFKNILIVLVVFIGIVNIGYRVMAEKKLIPYLAGQETEKEYLCKNLDFKTSVFVDCDGWFEKNIKPTDNVLVVGVHNLYYINFPFVHESWYRGEKYNYILTYNKTLNKKLIYKNDLTGMRLYAN